MSAGDLALLLRAREQAKWHARAIAKSHNDDQRTDAAQDRLTEIEDCITRTPARTIGDVLAKFRVALDLHPMHPAHHDGAMFHAILLDLQRLAERGTT